MGMDVLRALKKHKGQLVVLGFDKRGYFPGQTGNISGRLKDCKQGIVILENVEIDAKKITTFQYFSAI